MLDKTMKMLAAIAPGTYVPPGTACYDDAELTELGEILGKLVYAPSELRKRIEAFGATITRADFYAEVPTVAELEATFAQQPASFLDAPFQDRDHLRTYLADLAKHSTTFDPPVRPPATDRFGWANDNFTGSDAMSYYAMIRKVRPRTIVEMGCGTSTLVAREALAANGRGRLVCIEPFPSEMLRNLSDITLIDKPAQSLEVQLFDELLSDEDILFIDTTHTVKHNSDCIHIYLRLLPNLARDVFVHVHDIRLPEAFPLEMMRDLQVHWTEQYLLYAYLQDNPRVRTLYGSLYHKRNNPDGLRALMHGRCHDAGASFWFHQRKRG